jgi:hypothetical protein
MKPPLVIGIRDTHSTPIPSSRSSQEQHPGLCMTSSIMILIELDSLR